MRPEIGFEAGQNVDRIYVEIRRVTVVNCYTDMESLKTQYPSSRLEENCCPVNWAKRWVEFALENSCGHDIMCRDGMLQISLIVESITGGQGQPYDLELLRDICNVVLSLEGCELAITAAEKVKVSLDEHAEEWDQHCRRKRCKYLECKSYYSVYCDPLKCQGCTSCIKQCPTDAIAGGDGLISVVNLAKCVRCDICINACPNRAIAKYGAVAPDLPESPVPVGSFSGTRLRRRHRKNIT